MCCLCLSDLCVSLIVIIIVSPLDKPRCFGGKNGEYVVKKKKEKERTAMKEDKWVEEEKKNRLSC